MFYLKGCVFAVFTNALILIVDFTQFGFSDFNWPTALNQVDMLNHTVSLSRSIQREQQETMVSWFVHLLVSFSDRLGLTDSPLNVFI